VVFWPFWFGSVLRAELVHVEVPDTASALI
jgi:hypothetical protein